MGLLASLRWNWRVWLIVVTPIALSSLLISSESQINKCAFMMGICTVYWVTESLPLPITSLLPVVMAPMLGVLTTDEVCALFFSIKGHRLKTVVVTSTSHGVLNDMVMLVTGAVFVAYAIEESNLHRRIALRLLLLIGVQPKRLLFSIISITGFLSMWIANTVSTSLMAPIVHTVLADQIEARKSIPPPRALGDPTASTELELVNQESDVTEENKPLATQKEDQGQDLNANIIPINGRHSEDGEGLTTDGQQDDQSDEWKKMKILFNLAVCYSANIGGIGTLLGTPPNLVLAKTVADFTKDGVSPITYTSWLKFGMPVSLLTLLIVFVWMSVALFGFRNTFLCKRTSSKKEDEFLRSAIMKQYESLGVMSYHEKVVLVHFVILLLLFITRDPGIVPGWATFFPPKYVRDSVSAIAISTSLFVWPKYPPRLFSSSAASRDNQASHETTLSWKFVVAKFPWGIVFLLGGGVTLARASKTSGMSSVLVDYLSFVSSLPPWVTVLVLTTLTCIATEITSNTVITIIILPILGDLALKVQVNPLLYMLPVTAAASMAFMLPVATPPNAIIHAMGGAKISDMIKTGFGMNILGIIAINVIINTIGYWAFSLDTVPSWVAGLDDVTGNATTGAISSTVFNTIGNLTIATNQSTFI